MIVSTGEASLPATRTGLDEAEALGERGFTPRFVLFRAFFPGEQEPFGLEVERRDEKVDLALLRMERRPHNVPVLPLDRTRRGAAPGQPVVVVGYPTGLEAILAKADAAQVRSLLRAHGTSSQRITEALSTAGLIRPSTTQGHIGDITPRQLVYDAPTDAGGSGGPVFGLNGKVIGINQAVMPNTPSNFGVPIRYGIELLQKYKTQANANPPAQKSSADTQTGQ